MEFRLFLQYLLAYPTLPFLLHIVLEPSPDLPLRSLRHWFFLVASIQNNPIENVVKRWRKMEKVNFGNS